MYKYGIVGLCLGFCFAVHSMNEPLLDKIKRYLLNTLQCPTVDTPIDCKKLTNRHWRKISTQTTWEQRRALEAARLEPDEEKRRCLIAAAICAGIDPNATKISPALFFSPTLLEEYIKKMIMSWSSCSYSITHL